MTWLLVLSTAGLLIWQVRVTLRFPFSGPVKVLLCAQAAYWFVSYVARPITLLIFQPPPLPGDSVADPRLWVIGYETALLPIMAIISVGLFVYVTTLRIVGARLRPASIYGPLCSPSHMPFLLFWILGWAFRGISILAPSGAGVWHTLSLLAVIGSSGCIVFQGTSRWRGAKIWLAPVLAGEALWAIVTASKTPIIAAALALLIHFSLVGWNRRATRRTVALAVIVIFGFSSFQAYKLGADATEAFDYSISASYHESLAPLLQVERRLDLLTAVVDAHYFPNDERWLQPAQALERLFTSLLPEALIGEKEAAGRVWNQEVRARSWPESAASSVSLADGFIAEGYALAGLWGAGVEALGLLFITLVASGRLSSHGLVLPAWSLLMVSSPVLLERGGFGILEAASKNLQVALFASVLAAIHLAHTRRGRRFAEVDSGPQIEGLRPTVQHRVADDHN